MENILNGLFLKIILQHSDGSSNERTQIYENSECDYIGNCISLSGCSGYPHSSWLEDDSLDKLAEKRCEDIVAALENKDSSAIKAMFSQKAIEEAEDLDDEIEYIIEHYEGSLKSFKGTTSTEENINGKSKKTTVKADYTVITDKQTYVLFFVEVSNTDDETENGIYRLWLSKESEKDAYYGHFDAGIYIPEE